MYNSIMIYILILIFLLPIIIRFFHYNKITILILLPTFSTYVIWYITSFVMIYFSIDRTIYLSLFLCFPFSLLIYELWILFLNKHNLYWNKWLLGFLGFILLNLIINMFTYRYGWVDSINYIKKTTEFLSTGEYQPQFPYKYNSFYYISSLLGYYDIAHFYYVLIPFIFLPIIYFCIMEITNIYYVNIKKYLRVFLMTILIIFINSWTNSGANAISSIICALLFIISITKILRRSSECLIMTFIFDLSILFMLNFTMTGLITSIFMIVIMKIFIIIFHKNLFSLWNIPIYSILIVLFYVQPAGSTSTLIITSLIISIIVLIWYIRSFKVKLPKKYWDISNNLLMSKKFLYTLLFSVNFVFLSYTMAFLIVYAKLNNLNIGIKIILIISIVNININILFITKQYVFLSTLLLFMTTLLFLYTLQLSSIRFEKLKVPVYLTDRVTYMIGFFIIFWPIASLWNIIAEKGKYMNIFKKIFLFFIPMTLMFNIISPMSLNYFNTIFSTSLSLNNNMNKENYWFLFDNKELFERKTFSEIDNPFTISIAIAIYYKGILYKPGDKIQTNFFAIFTNYKQVIKSTIQKMYFNVENQVPFESEYKTIILRKNSFLNQNKNILNNYKIISSNEDINIWIKK